MLKLSRLFFFFFFFFTVASYQILSQPFGPNHPAFCVCQQVSSAH